MLLPILAVIFLAKEPSDALAKATLREHVACLFERDGWILSAIYGVTFGCFIGLASYLPSYYHDQFGVSKVQAGELTMVVSFIGAAVRVAGGWLSDRFGGVTTLSWVLAIVAMSLAGAGFAAASLALTTLLLMACFGGARRRQRRALPARAPACWPATTAVAGSMIGELGALAGGLVPNAMGLSKQFLGTTLFGFVFSSPPWHSRCSRRCARCRAAEFQHLGRPRRPRPRRRLARSPSRRPAPEARFRDPGDPRHEQTEARDDRQRHGRRAHAGGAAEDRPRPVRHHRVRRRAASELQPHPALARARGRADLRRDRAERHGLVRGARHHPARRQGRDAHRPPPPRRPGRGRHRGRLRPPADRHRLDALRAACAGQGPGGRHRLSRHRRHAGDDRGRDEVPPRGRHRRRPARARGRQRTDAARHEGHRGAPHALADGAPAR